MPLIHVRALPQKPSVIIPSVLQKLNLEVAQKMDLEPRFVWSTWTYLDPLHYVEGDQTARSQALETHPPIVEFLAFEGRPQKIIETAMTTIAEVLCRELELSEGNAFVTYHEIKSGGVYSAGEIER